ncbi:MAG: autotransporter domain-containing protein [Phascolarctobacterium sp.]
MRISFKQRSLGKKVLLSVLAAGVMSGFVLQPQVFAAESVNTDKLELNKGVVVEYSGGTVTGRAEEHADVAAEVREGSTLVATDVAFTGEIAIDNGSKVTLTGGSVTSGVQRIDEGVPLEEPSTTEIGVRDGGTLFTANNVKLDTNLGAFDGGQIIVNNSNINAPGGIYASGEENKDTAIITLNGSDSNTYKFSEYFEADGNAIIKVYGGGTISKAGIDYTEGYDYPVIRISNGADLDIESGNGTTNINSSVYVEDATMYVSGKLNINPVDEVDRGVLHISGASEVVFGKYEADERDEEAPGTIVGDDAIVKVDSIIMYNTSSEDNPNPELCSLTVGEGSELNITSHLEATGNIDVTVNGKFTAPVLWSYSGAVVNLNNGGTIDVRKFAQDRLDNEKFESVKGGTAVKVANGEINATNVDIYGGIWADQPDSKISLKGGSVVAVPVYDEAGNPDGYSELGASDGASIVITDSTSVKSEIYARYSGKVTFNNSNVDTASINQGISAIGMDNFGNKATIIFNGTSKNTYTVGDVFLANDGGKIYINGGTLKDNALKSKMYGIKSDYGTELNTDAKGIVLDQNGVIETMSDQIYANAAGENVKDSGVVTNEGIDFVGGTLSLNDAKYTLGYVATALAQLKEVNANSTTKVVMNGELVGVEGSVDVGDIAGSVGDAAELDNVTAKSDGNLLVGDATATGNVEGVDVGTAVDNGFSVASLDLTNGASGVVITNDKSVTLGGSQGGDVVTVDGTSTTSVTIVLGANDNKGTLNIGNSKASDNTQYNLNGEVVVNNDSSLNTKGQVTVTNQVSLNGGTVNVQTGSLTTSTLEVKESGNLVGNVNATELTLKSDTTLTNIGNNDAAGKLTVENADLKNGTVFLDPAWRDGATISDASGLAVMNAATINGAFVVGRNSVLSLGADLATAEAVFGRSEAAWGQNSVSAAAYVADTVNVAGGSITVDGSLTAAPAAPAAGSVNFADKSMLMVDGAKTEATAAITGVDGDAKATIDAGAKLYIDNAQKDKTYKILAGTDKGWQELNISSNNRLLAFTADGETDGAFNVTAVSRAMADAYGEAVIAPNTFDQAVIVGGSIADFVAKAADEHVNATTAAQVSAFNSAAAMSELAGVEHGTFAASNLFTDAVAEHMSLVGAKDHDKDIWAKYIHSKNEVDGLALAGNHTNYDATYNGIVVGSDLYKQGKGIVGAALTYVDGSIKGNTLAARTENDATYYGLSIYGGIKNEDSVVVGDISYLHGKNDITQRNSGMSLTADAKSDAFSIGVRAEKAIKSGVGKFAPYAGLRYMHLGTGNYTNSIGIAYDSDDMNLWLLPVGVKYSADIQNGDWTIRPVAEFGYVWNMGDRNANQTVSLNGASDGFGFDVADSGSYVGRLAVEAQKANVTYGLGYEYQKGDSVKTNKWMANVNWTF